MTDQPSRATPTMAPLDALAVLLGLLVLVGGITTGAVTGQWAGVIFVVPISFGLLLWAGRDGLPQRQSRVQVRPCCW